MVGIDPALLAETLAATRKNASESMQHLEAERKGLLRQYRRDQIEIQRIVGVPLATDRLAELQDVLRRAERRMNEIEDEITALSRELPVDEEVEAAVLQFDPVWDALCPGEQQRLVRLYVKEVRWDGENSDVSITFRPTGITAPTEPMIERGLP